MSGKSARLSSPNRRVQRQRADCFEAEMMTAFRAVDKGRSFVVEFVNAKGVHHSVNLPMAIAQDLVTNIISARPALPLIEGSYKFPFIWRTGCADISPLVFLLVDEDPALAFSVVSARQLSRELLERANTVASRGPRPPLTGSGQLLLAGRSWGPIGYEIEIWRDDRGSVVKATGWIVGDQGILEKAFGDPDVKLKLSPGRSVDVDVDRPRGGTASIKLRGPVPDFLFYVGHRGDRR